MTDETINRYGSLAAWVYDVDKPVGRSFGDVDYYRDRLAGCAGPVLEAACGNGRLLVPLLTAGLGLHGFDASPEMLALCRAACRDRGFDPPLSLQRFESFAFDTRFAAIVVAVGSIQLVTDPAVLRGVLRRFLDHLRPGGRLLVDLVPVDPPEQTARTRRWPVADGELWLDEQPVTTDPAADVVVSRLRYEHRRGGVPVATEEEPFALRRWDAAAFAAVLDEVGFTRTVVSGGYRFGEKPRPDDAVVSLEAVRPA